MITNTPRNGDPPYFKWLIDKVKADNYILLSQTLFNCRYTWSIARDENRANDGLYLRQLYSDETGEVLSDVNTPCSVLEMFVALVLRMEREVIDIPAYESFAQIIMNLYLAEFDDEHYNDMIVRRRIDTFLNRVYDANGAGGAFPLYNPAIDQRNVELWEQMQQWVAENYSLV